MPEAGETNPARIAVVIVNYRTSKLAIECLETVQRERATLPNITAMLVDGGSDDGSVEIFDEYLQTADLGWAALIALPFNGGFGWANNQAIKRLLQSARPPDFIYLLNPDAILEPEAILRLVEAMHANPRIGAVGSQLYEPDGRKAGSAFHFPTIATEFFRGAATPALERLCRHPNLVVVSDTPCPADWVTGASVMFRAEALRACGLFDEGFFLYFEEIELMHRMRRAGWEMWHVPASRVRHIGGASTGVTSGLDESPKRRPSYWFKARRRVFTLLYGPRASAVSAIAWAAGHGLTRLRAALGRPRPGAYAAREFADLFENGIKATPDDLSSAIGRWNDPLDALPAWALREAKASHPQP